MAHPHNGVLFRDKKEERIDSCHNMEEVCKHSAKLNRPDIKGTYLMVPFT